MPSLISSALTNTNGPTAGLLLCIGIQGPGEYVRWEEVVIPISAQHRDERLTSTAEDADLQLHKHYASEIKQAMQTAADRFAGYWFMSTTWESPQLLAAALDA